MSECLLNCYREELEDLLESQPTNEKVEILNLCFQMIMDEFNKAKSKDYTLVEFVGHCLVRTTKYIKKTGVEIVVKLELEHRIHNLLERYFKEVPWC